MITGYFCLQTFLNGPYIILLHTTIFIPVVDIVIEAVHSGRSRIIPWRELTDTTRWQQGWR